LVHLEGVAAGTKLIIKMNWIMQIV